MKAFLMAAGLGSRLRPITNKLPKCLVPINGVPLINYWLSLFKMHHITDIMINSHYLHDQVELYLSQNDQGLSISLIYEEELLGSLGTLIKHSDQYSDDSQLMVCYADNLTDTNLTRIINYHNSHTLDVTIGIFNCDRPEHCGIVELDSSGTVVSFEEKPRDPRSNLANAGVYIFNTKLFDEYVFTDSKYRALDIGHDLLPHLTGRMKGYLIEEYLVDIGTIENYRLANEQMRICPINIKVN